MARVRRNRSPNDDLVEAAENCLPNILMFYLVFCKVVAAGVKTGKTGDYSKVTGRIE